VFKLKEEKNAMHKDAWKSRDLLQRPEMAAQRALWKAVGYTDRDLKQPLVGVVNSWTELTPGHSHLRSVAEAVKIGIWQAGGTPFEWNTFATCPLITLDLFGGKYDTPARDLIAASVEAVVPGHLLAAARLNVPSIIVPGGPMFSGRYMGRDIATGDLDATAWAIQLETCKFSSENLKRMEDAACPGSGACALLGTANTMQCLSEAVGIALPYAGTAPAASAKRLWLARESGRQIVSLIREGISPMDIFTKEALENMIRVLHAIGGSTNAVLHILALAQEVDLLDEISLETFDKLSRETPCICNVKPSGTYAVSDLDEAGGIPAVMKNLSSLLNLDVLTVTGKTVGENIKDAQNLNDEVIRPLNRPLYREGLAVLRGNLANSAIARPTVMPKEMLKFKGAARVFDSQSDALAALANREINPGEILVVRYEGPRGGPGTSDIFKVLGYLCALDLDKSCALVTDGKFSGFARGPGVCQVSPEAAVGGPIALVKDGDIIEIDVPNRQINVQLSDQEIQKRLAEWRPPEPKVKRGFLTLYARMAEPVERGGGLPLRL